MNDKPIAASERDAFLENFAVELTDVAYQVALRHGAGEKWLDLQLELWGAMTQMIENRSRLHPTNLASEIEIRCS